MPGIWEKVGYPSLKPLGGWVLDYQQRVTFMRNWLQRGNPPTYWLPGRGLHSSTFRLNVSTFSGIRWVHDFPPVY